jgi:hypothetical protein
MGGMYVDTDMECLRNFSFLLEDAGKNMFISLNPDFLAIETVFVGRCCNHWFYCPNPEFEGLLQLLVSITGTKIPKNTDVQWTIGVTGPLAISKMCAARKDVGYISWHLLEGKSLSNCRDHYKGNETFPCAFAIHHRGGTWVSKAYSGMLRSGIVSMYGGIRHNSLIIIIVSVLLIFILLSIIIWMAVRHNKMLHSQ